MRKKVLYGKEARDSILTGINKIADAVVTTLGPMGRNVLISESVVVEYNIHNLPVKVTKDGYNSAKAFDLDDPFEKSGVMLVKEASQKTVDQAGDGTTSTVLLMREIVKNGIKLINEGANPMELKRSIDLAVEYVVNELKKMAVPVKGDNDRIRQIATVSANNDPEIGGWIADAFAKIGDEGVIDLEASQGVSTEIKIAQGYKWDKGWCSPYFVNIPEKQSCEFENPLILLYEKKINHHSQVQKILERMPQGRPILIICEDVVDEGLAFLGMNALRGRLKVCVVKSPSFGETRREDMEDIALLTGATYLSDTKGVSIKDAMPTVLGTAQKVIISKDETVVIGDDTDKKALENLLNELRMNLAQAKNEEEKAPIEKRIAKLTGGVAVIQVGAATETEMKEKLDRFDDAVRATKAAISEGYVPGGSTAFLRVPLPVVKDDSLHGGYNVIFDALEKPIKQICENAGVDAEKIYQAVKKETGNVGYNAKKGVIEDLVAAGIIDPLKVLRCALQNAASSASMVLTTECLIVDVQ